MRLSWPIGVVTLPFGLVYCFLLCFLGDAIAASEKMAAQLSGYEWGGVDALFAMNSGLLGWAGVVVAAKRFGISGPSLFLIALPWSLGALGGGFAVALLVMGSLPHSIWQILGICVVFMISTAVFRTYVDDVV